MTMLEYVLNKGQEDKRFTNVLLLTEITSHVLGMMKAVLDFRKDFKIIG